MALIRGIVKAVLEAEERDGGILDSDFIREFTNGFELYKKTVRDTPWEKLISASGVEKNQIIEAAEIYIMAKNTIASWCLGITHHRNSIETIREIVNLMLLKGNIGRDGAGVLPRARAQQYSGYPDCRSKRKYAGCLSRSSGSAFLYSNSQKSGNERNPGN